MEASRGEGIRSQIGPFSIVPEWVLDAEISDRAVVLYAVLGLYANRGTKASFPRKRTLAARLRCSTASIDRARRELVEIGALAVEPRFEEATDGTRQTSNRWILATTPPGVTSDTGAAAPLTPQEPEPQEPEGETTATPSSLAVQGDSEPAYDPRKGIKIDGRNLPWDALVAVTQSDPLAEAGRIGQGLKRIRDLIVSESARHVHGDGKTTWEGWPPEEVERLIAEEITRRGNLYADRWPNVELTPTALATNWTRVTIPPKGGDVRSTIEAAQRGIDAARGGSP